MTHESPYSSQTNEVNNYVQKFTNMELPPMFMEMLDLYLEENKTFSYAETVTLLINKRKIYTTENNVKNEFARGKKQICEAIRQDQTWKFLSDTTNKRINKKTLLRSLNHYILKTQNSSLLGMAKPIESIENGISQIEQGQDRLTHHEQEKLKECQERILKLLKNIP